MEIYESASPRAKKRKVSKNKKKNWRKHSDIKDVEDFLEDQRLQLRTGGIIAEKPDEKLFFEDKAQPSEVTVKKKRTFKPIFRQLVPDPNIKPRPKRTVYNPRKPTRNKALKRKIEESNELEKLGIFTEGRLQRLEESSKQSAKHNDEKVKERQSIEAARAEYDLWGEDADPVSKAYGKKAGDEASEHFLRVTKKVPRKLPTKYFKKPNKVPAVEVAAPGASYNPSFEDHQKLILDTYKVEAEKEKKEEKLLRWHSNIKKLGAKEVEKNYMNEMSAGLFSNPDDPTDTPAAGDDELTANPPVIAESRKTKKTRRKEKEEKVKAQKLKSDKVDRIRFNEVYRLRGIKRELKGKEEVIETNTQARIDKKIAEEGLPKQVGRHPVEEADFAIKLSDELVGTLRELKPEVDLLVDRYKHFQKRNLIEARTTVKKKDKGKRKLKEYTRKSHKEDEDTLPFRSRGIRTNMRKLMK